MSKPIRRIVTTNDERGRSRILIDGPATKKITVLTEMWLTDGLTTGNEDFAERSTQLEPPRHGTLFRYFEIAPERDSAHLSEEERYRAAREWFADMKAEHLQVDTSRYPAMHKSETTDYIILLSGRVTLILDDEEVDLEPLDAVIQRGTNHGWANRGTEPALLMAVLVDARVGQAGETHG